MNRKRRDVESSSGEEEDEEQEDEEEDETGGESVSEEDEFDSEDDRVNVIPGQSTEQTPSEAAKASVQGESSSESDEEDDTVMVDAKQPVETSHQHTQQNVQTFDSDVESEYETESSSESEGLTQEAAEEVVKGTPIESMEASPPSQKKVQEVQASGSKQTTKEGNEVAIKGKNKATKQQQKDTPPLRFAKGEVLKTTQEESQSFRKGQGEVIKDIASDDSVRDDKRLGGSSRKRKIQLSQHDVERDSAESGPISKKRKDAEVSHNGKKRAAKHTVSQTPSDTGMDVPSSRKKVPDKPSHTLVDVAKEIARKTLNSAAVRDNGSKDVLDSKTSALGHETKQEKKSNSTAVNKPASTSKQKKLPHVWSVDEEIIVAYEVLNRVKMGLEVPSKRNDDFWGTLSEIMQEKLGSEFSRDQLSEKVRRMKQKYQGAVQKIEESQDSKKPFKHKSNGEQRLFDILSQIWGRAEVTSLEDQQVDNNVTKIDLSKSIQSPDREVKSKNISPPNARPSTKANAGKNEAAPIAENVVDPKAKVVATTLAKLDHGQVVKEDLGRIILHTPTDSFDSPINNVDTLLQEKIQATLHELQEWSKRNLEDWMNKAYGLIEDSTRRLEDQARHMNWVVMAGGGLPTRFCNGMDTPPVQGDKTYRQKWHELQLQELNVHVQRLDLMRKECELKQEQLKAQLQEVQKQK